MINKIFENPYHKKMIVRFSLNTFIIRIACPRKILTWERQSMSTAIYVYFNVSVIGDGHLSIALTYCNRFVSENIDEKKVARGFDLR